MYASIALWPLWSHAAELDLPRQPGTFWLQLDALPEQPRAPVAQADTLRFDSLSALTEHALRERPESRAAWLGIQAEAARLDAISAANWPTLTGHSISPAIARYPVPVRRCPRCTATDPASVWRM